MTVPQTQSLPLPALGAGEGADRVCRAAEHTWLARGV